MMVSSLALLLQSSLSPAPFQCEVIHQIGERSVEIISIDCPDVPGREQGEAAIRESIEAVEIGRVSRFLRGREIDTYPWVFSIDTDESVEWLASSVPIVREMPDYPSSQLANEVSAICRSHFDWANGNTNIQTVACNTSSSRAARAFERSTRNALESWIYSDGLPVVCLETETTFFIGDESMAPQVPPLADCGLTEEHFSSYPEAIRPYLPLLRNHVPAEDFEGHAPTYFRHGAVRSSDELLADGVLNPQPVGVPCAVVIETRNYRFSELRLRSLELDCSLSGLGEVAEQALQATADEWLDQMAELDERTPPYNAASEIRFEQTGDGSWTPVPNQLLVRVQPFYPYALEFRQIGYFACGLGLRPERDGLVELFATECIAPGDHSDAIVEFAHSEMYEAVLLAATFGRYFPSPHNSCLEERFLLITSDHRIAPDPYPALTELGLSFPDFCEDAQ